MPYKTPNVSSLGSPGVQVDLRGKRSESSIFAERENVHLSWELGFHKGRAARELVFFRPRNWIYTGIASIWKRQTAFSLDPSDSSLIGRHPATVLLESAGAQIRGFGLRKRRP